LDAINIEKVVSFYEDSLFFPIETSNSDRCQASCPN